MRFGRNRVKNHLALILKADIIEIEPVCNAEFGNRTNIDAIVTSILGGISKPWIKNNISSVFFICFVVRDNRGVGSVPISMIVDTLNRPINSDICAERAAIIFAISFRMDAFKDICSRPVLCVDF